MTDVKVAKARERFTSLLEHSRLPSHTKESAARFFNAEEPHRQYAISALFHSNHPLMYETTRLAAPYWKIDHVIDVWARFREHTESLRATMSETNRRALATVEDELIVHDTPEEGAGAESKGRSDTEREEMGEKWAQFTAKRLDAIASTQQAMLGISRAELSGDTPYGLDTMVDDLLCFTPNAIGTTVFATGVFKTIEKLRNGGIALASGTKKRGRRIIVKLEDQIGNHGYFIDHTHLNTFLAMENLNRMLTEQRAILGTGTQEGRKIRSRMIEEWRLLKHEYAALPPPTLAYDRLFVLGIFRNNPELITTYQNFIRKQKESPEQKASSERRLYELEGAKKALQGWKGLVWAFEAAEGFIEPTSSSNDPTVRLFSRVASYAARDLAQTVNTAQTQAALHLAALEPKIPSPAILDQAIDKVDIYLTTKGVERFTERSSESAIDRILSLVGPPSYLAQREFEGHWLQMTQAELSKESPQYAILRDKHDYRLLTLLLHARLAERFANSIMPYLEGTDAAKSLTYPRGQFEMMAKFLEKK